MNCPEEDRGTQRPLLPRADRICLGWGGQVGTVCPPSQVIGFSLGNFTFSPGSLKEEERAQWLLSHPGQRTDSRDERVQILEALQLAGEMWGAGKAGRWRLDMQGLSSALGRGGGPWVSERLLCICFGTFPETISFEPHSDPQEELCPFYGWETEAQRS